eukprot:3958192-Prymnesium_polylepis.1
MATAHLGAGLGAVAPSPTCWPSALYSVLRLPPLQHSSIPACFQKISCPELDTQANALGTVLIHS